MSNKLSCKVDKTERARKPRGTGKFEYCLLVLALLAGSGLGNAPLMAAEEELPVPSPEKRKVIDELFALSGVEGQAENSLENMTRIIRANLRATISSQLSKDESISEDERKALSEEQSEKIMVVFKKKLDIREELLTLFASIYDKNFTETELKEMVIFYKSPVGVKFSQAMPEMTKDASAELQKKLDPRIKELMAEKMEKSGDSKK